MIKITFLRKKYLKRGKNKNCYEFIKKRVQTPPKNQYFLKENSKIVFFDAYMAIFFKL
jgi:hypothetical protein